MKEILIITAHPNSKSLTSAIAQTYKKKREELGDSVEIVDLYMDKQLPFLTFKTCDDLSVQTLEREYYQDKVKYADEIVIVYPLWWGSIPAILKNWLDQVLMRGFAFEYGSNNRPNGLLQGRNVKVFTTAGAPKFLYCINGIRRANRNIWKKSIVEFCGMDFDGFYLYGGVTKDSKNADSILRAVEKIAEKENS